VARRSEVESLEREGFTAEDIATRTGLTVTRVKLYMQEPPKKRPYVRHNTLSEPWCREIYEERKSGRTIAQLISKHAVSQRVIYQALTVAELLIARDKHAAQPKNIQPIRAPHHVAPPTAASIAAITPSLHAIATPDGVGIENHTKPVAGTEYDPERDGGKW
jgi:hypothetical protein